MFRWNARPLLAVLLIIMVALAGCSTAATPAADTATQAPAAGTPEVIEKQVTRVVEVPVTAVPEAAAHAKYVFLFIGDGMGVAQRNAAELYLAATAGADARPEETTLVMNTFPAQGMDTTYDLTSVIPDSASTATAIATGIKTASGVISMSPDGSESYRTISEIAKDKGWKVGVISTVSLDHATPAVFYSHQASRKNMYDICMQLANSDFDYFAGGQMLKPTNADDPNLPSAIDTAVANGFTVVTDRAGFESLEPGVGKVLAMNGTVDDSAAMYYELDRAADDLSLVDYVVKGIELLDNPDGFFMMIEGGKIDWACHANDAAASIHDTLVFDEAIAVAVEFYNAHPDETLIVVTGDHETGGMTIGYAGTQYNSFVDQIQYQTMSYVEFGNELAAYKETHTPETANFEDMVPLIEEGFGLRVLSPDELADLEAKAEAGDANAEKALSMVLDDLELQVLEQAFADSMAGDEIRSDDEYTYLLYGGYEPLAVKLTTILNQKSGIAWTSYSHTGVPVQTSALGVGCEAFNGYYDETDIFTKMMGIAGF